MRVLNVTGGVSANASAQTAQRLEHYFAGHDITCGIFESSNPKFQKIAEEKGIESIFFGPSATDRFSSISLLPGVGYSKAALHACREISSYDLIHVYGGPLFHGPVGTMISLTSQCPLITRFNGYIPLPDSEPKRTIVRTIIRGLLRSNGVVFNSHAQKNDILDTYGTNDTDNIRVIPPGVDQKKFSPVTEINQSKIPKEVVKSTTVIGSVLTPRPVKRLDRAFDIVETLAESHDITYAILGDGEKIDRYQNLAAEKGISDYVYWAGHVDQSELASWYSLFDATILTSEWESFGMSITESYLCETPCVAFDIGGMSDQIIDGNTGYLIDPYNTDAFAAALDKLITNEEMSVRFGNKGRKYVQGKFTLESVSKQYSSLLESLVQ
jgi:glycosyltransferase involved in cell wall biosynthesis